MVLFLHLESCGDSDIAECEPSPRIERFSGSPRQFLQAPIARLVQVLETSRQGFSPYDDGKRGYRRTEFCGEVVSLSVSMWGLLRDSDYLVSGLIRRGLLRDPL